MKYRNDIDGLRALAVSTIVLFHFGVSELPGGFIGVDVFFVISGFLITKLILEDIRRDRFSVGDFYLRRLRRLGPSLLATLSFTLLAGYFILAPTHFQELGLATQAAVFSVSNVLFWTQSGYFDTEAINKPLLHTWSLSVEEQFYVLWPLTLMFLFKVTSLVRALMVLFAAAAISLLSAEFMLSRDPGAAFFLPIFRIYEFACGAALAMTGAIAKQRRLADAASFVGLGLIVGSSLTFSEYQPFPGLAALVPCLGASLLIFSGPTAVLNRAISVGPVRYIGLISYSLYLVHWPLVVFYTYHFGVPVTWAEIALLGLVACLMGSLFYHFIETPFRRRTPNGFRISGKWLGGMTFFAAVLIIFLGGKVDKEDGYPQRFSDEMRTLSDQIKSAKQGRSEAIRRATCHFKAKRVGQLAEDFENCLPDVRDGSIVILGDSHAADIWAGLSRTYPNQTFVQLTGGGCSLARGLVESARENSAHCETMEELARAWLSENSEKVSAIIYSQRASPMMIGKLAEPKMRLEPNTEILRTLKDELKGFTKLDIPVFFWGPRPEFYPPIDKAIKSFPTLTSLERNYRSIDITPYRFLDSALAELFSEGSVKYFSSLKPLCTPDCTVLIDSEYPAIIDYGHWSPRGAQFAVERIIEGTPFLKSLLEHSDVTTRTR